MLSFGMSMTGLTDIQLAKAAEAIRPAVADEMIVIMARGRSQLVERAQGVFLAHGRRGKPRTVTQLTKAKASSQVTATGVVGMLKHRAFLLNILEGGAHPKAFTLTPSRGKAVRFYRSGVPVFARGPIQIPARTIAPRPIVLPVFNRLVPYAQERIEQTVVEVINRADSI